MFAELARAPKRKARRARALLSRVELLDEPPGLQDVVEYYIEHRLMPAEAGGDAVHLALASLNSVDFLLTWNCRHLANAVATRHRKLLRENPLASWQLRVQDFRVLYNIDQERQLVVIVAIGRKERNLLLIEGEEHLL